MPRPNRLINETSPYLLQHAHNPVDWFPWGGEAFAAATSQGKPIFLSVGYSTCYWCHVMERQCFENPSIADEMNRRFINIKVDREERPDVDQLYMTATQILTRHAGWPMSVFLTPDLKPFYAGTYFPPTDSPGRPGLPTLLRAMEDAHHNRPDEVRQTTDQLLEILHQLAEPPPPPHDLAIDADFIDRQLQRCVADFDPINGGFGSAPKFPRQTFLELLLHYCATPTGNLDFDDSRRSNRRDGFMDMIARTLDALAAGGIRDHLGGAFHRYSTDAAWIVPHFEIMLYDNAMLAWIYLESYRQTERRDHATVARGILDFILSDMTAPSGGFFTALDAETDTREGATHLWTPDEIVSALGPDDGPLFNRVYGLSDGFNFADPHHGDGVPDRNVLRLPRPVADIAGELDEPLESLENRLADMRRRLLAVRKTRPQPALDRKVLTAWNALTIRAFAFAGQLLDEPRYLDAAAKAADYLLRRHRTPDGGLIRSSRPDLDSTPAAPGAPAGAIPAFLDDYAFFMQALIALRDATGDDDWQQHAATLAMKMLDDFADPHRGGFYFSPADQTDILVRQKIATDSPLPSGNAIAASALIDLGHDDRARDILTAFASTLADNPESSSALLQVAIQYVRRLGPIPVPAGARDSDFRTLSPDALAKSVVTLSAAWSDDTTLAVRADILDGFHLNAHDTATGLRATQLSITGPAARLVESIDYPPGETRRFPFADQPLTIHEKSLTIAVRFTRPPRAPVDLSLQYQPCDTNACLPVTTQSLTVSIA